MEKIIITKQLDNRKTNRRASVAIKPETYKKICDISFEANVPIETITQMLLEEALKYVEIKEV